MIAQTKARLIALVAFPLFLLAPTPGRCAPAAAAGASQMQHISVEVTGKGPPVILIPGLSSPRATYDGVAPMLAASHRVYRVQVNGFGGDDPRGNLTSGLLDGVVADLHTLIARDRIAGAAVVGHSLGGLVGLMLARAHPADVGRLMVVDALPFVGDIFVPGATVAMVEPQAKALRDQMAAGYGQPANPAIGQAIAARNALKPASRTLVAGWMDRADPRVSAEAMYEDMTTDLRPAMASIATPITVVVPYSAELPEAKVNALYSAAYKAAPHATLVPVADSGHFVMLDQLDAFAAAVRDFLDAH